MGFHGKSVVSTLAAVLKEEPDWSILPAATPVRVRILLRQCLQKNPKQRLQAIGDARIALDEVLFACLIWLMLFRNRHGRDNCGSYPGLRAWSRLSSLSAFGI